MPFATSGYDIDITCTKGYQYIDRWEYTSSAPETFSFAIAIYKDGEKIAEGLSTVITVAVGVTSQSAKVLIIGDSTVASGYLGQRILDNCTSDGHLSVTLLGTLGSTPNLHEGRNGWTISSYVTQSSYLGISNPFYHNNTFDLAYYLSTYNIDTPDYVLIQLGINDMFELTNDAQVNGTINIVLPRLGTIIDSIKSVGSSIKIGFNITIPPNASQNAYGAALGCGQTQWRYKRNNIMWVNALVDYLKERDDVYMVATNLAIDSSTMIADTVHPNTSTGYPTIGDVDYAFIKATIS